MLSPTLRARLSRIARRLPAIIPGEAPDREAARGTVESPVGEHFLFTFDPLACGECMELECGPVYRIRAPLPDLLEDYAERVRRLEAASERPALLIDIETAGLAGMPVFLIGALGIERGGMQLVQILARDYSEEAAALHAFAALSVAWPRWVTYNGRSFDLPYLADRRVYHGLCGPDGDRAPVPTEHLDLLVHARRRWKRTLPDCRLQTLERAVCRRMRLGDVPGEAIPALYHEYVRTGNWEILTPVLHHNAMDLLTLSELLAVLTT